MQTNAGVNPFSVSPTKLSTSCPNRHPLIENITPIAGFSCNRCTLTTNAPANSRFFSCRSCDYDVCNDCYSGRKNALPAPKVASSETPKAGPSSELLKQIQLALENPSAVHTHAKAWFKRYDEDGSGTLSMDELQKLCVKLNSDLGIPPVEEKVVEQLVRKFDTDEDRCLSLEEFNTFYQRLLMTVKDHYGGFKVKREFFLSKKNGKPTDRYKVQRTLGHGSFGVVSLVEDLTTKRMMVLKTINKEKSKLSPEILEQEFKNLVLLDHPHVIKLFDYYEDFVNVYVVMELAEGGELLHVVQRSAKAGKVVEESWARDVFCQVLEALAYCHSRGVMHKDIKSENILLMKKDPVHAVVIDFGLAEAFKQSSARSDVVSGTPYTMAPEVWTLALGRGSIGYKCDVYSLGCVMFHALSGQFPIVARGCDATTWLTVIKKGPNWSLMSHCSAEAIELCKRMLSVREDDRPTARECLSHPWFQLASESLKSKLSSDQIKALAMYTERSAFEKAVLLQVATLASAADIPKINSVFRSIDKSAQGVLDRNRCAEALVRLGIPSEKAHEIAKGLDADGDNRIEYSEFVAGVIDVYEERMNDLLWGVFQRIDIDGNGQLDTNEIKQVLKKGELNNLGLSPTDKDIDIMFKQLDRDGSGKISYDEFKACVLHKQ